MCSMRGERYRYSCDIERNAWGGHNIIVWVVISLINDLGPMCLEMLVQTGGMDHSAAHH